MARATWAWTAIAAAGLLLLSAAMPPHVFFSGDSGVKLIAARSVIASPSWPIRVEPPAVGGQPAPELMEPFFVPHGDHAHAMTSGLLPLLSAPFIAAFGLRGALLIPIASLVAMLPLLALAQRRLDLAVAPALLGALILLAGPLLFYALEFWEHVPAAASLAGVTALAWGARRAEHAAAGVCAALAVLFRPEAAWYVAAIAVAMLWTGRPLRAVITMSIAAAAILAIPAAATYAHSGSLLEPHLAANTGSLGDGWLSARGRIAGSWLALSPSGLPRQSLWQWWPSLALAAVPLPAARPIQALRLVLVVCVAGILLTVPNDGGAQWGPRYLLVAAPALLLLATEGAAALWRRRRPLFAAAVVVSLVGGVAMTRAAYRELRGSKQLYAEVVDQMERALGGTRIVVTDIWWLDQVAASLADRVTFLFVDSGRRAAALAARIERTGPRDFSVVRAPESPVFAATGPWFAGSCFEARPVATVPARRLEIYRADCR